MDNKEIEIIIDNEKDKHKIENLRALVSKEISGDLHKLNLQEKEIKVTIEIKDKK